MANYGKMLQRKSKERAGTFERARVWLGESLEVRCANILQVQDGRILHTDELQIDARPVKFGRMGKTYWDHIFDESADQAAYTIDKRSRREQDIQRGK